MEIRVSGSTLLYYYYCCRHLAATNATVIASLQYFCMHASTILLLKGMYVGMYAVHREAKIQTNCADFGSQTNELLRPSN